MKKKSLYIYLGVLTGTILLNIIAWNSRTFCDWYIMHVLPLWVNTYGRLTGLLPFSLGEFMLIAAVLLILTAFLTGILRFAIWARQKGKGQEKGAGQRGVTFKIRRFCRGYHLGFAWIALGVFVILTLNCFICYHGTDFCTRYFPEVEKEGREYSLEELMMVRDFVVVKCNALAEQMERDAQGNVIYTGDMETTAIQCMQALGEEYEQLAGFYPKPKGIYYSEFLSQQYIQGYFFPFSMEANINRIMKIMNKPATMCHELAHLKGFLQEDEANLIGYLACIGSEDPFFQYSGYLSVLNYLDNDFYDAVGQNREDYLAHVQISAQVRADNKFLSEDAWEIVEKKAVISTETVDKISDEIMEATLIMNGVEDGTLSYCRVVGLLLDYYSIRTEIGEEFPQMVSADGE